MRSEALTLGRTSRARRAALLAIGVAASLVLAGCEQLKAIGAMVGIGGDEPVAAPTPAPRPRPPVAQAPRPAGSPLAQAPAPGASPSAQRGATAPSPAGADAARRPSPTQPVAAAPASTQPSAAAPAATRPVAVAPASAQPSAPPAPGASPTVPVVMASAPATAPQLPALPAAGEPFDPSGRRDPFRPFVTSAELAARRAKDDLSPLQKLELSQLRLVAIVWGTRQNHAMVEDSAGVGYVLRVGTRVGPNGGRVARIAPDAVYVEESFRDSTGTVLTNQITLRLPERNPGGKGS